MRVSTMLNDLLQGVGPGSGCRIGCVWRGKRFGEEEDQLIIDLR